jgi:hypothetical protein
MLMLGKPFIANPIANTNNANPANIPNPSMMLMLIVDVKKATQPLTSFYSWG